MGKIDKQVDESRDLTVYTAVGEVNGDDFVRAIETFYQGAITKNVLWDVGGADLRRVEPGEIKGIAKIPRQHFEERRGGKTAIVVASDLAFGLTRMYEIQTNVDEQPFETNVFRSLDDAYSWLDEGG